MVTNKMPKNAEKFHCELCNFKCSKKSNYDAHCLTAKHKMVTNGDKNGDILRQKMPQLFTCECGKSYKHRQGLSRHKKICKKMPNNVEDENVTSNPVIDDEKKELIEIIKKQSEQINQLIPCVGNNNNNNTTNNFNLNFFLNNDCKDAMNITDFIESLQVQLKELEYTADNGHVKGITNIFHTALANMEENKRPMHCTDLKREVLYIKDNNEWHKDEDKDILKSAVTKVVDKNCENQAEWLDNHPDVLVTGSKDSNKYIKMMDACLGKGDDTEQHKIMKNIMKDVKLETK
jgi:hypothetical protein